MQADIEYYLRNGYVFTAPEYFVMGRQIHGGWYVHAAVGVGAIEKLLQHLPYYLPYIGWERHGSATRWYHTEKLSKKLLKEKYASKKTSRSNSTARSN